jgi:hypothetical protein
MAVTRGGMVLPVSTGKLIEIIMSTMNDLPFPSYLLCTTGRTTTRLDDD